jgi:hypothetical protein
MTEQNGCIKFNKKSWHYRVVVFYFGKYFFNSKRYVHGDWIEKGYDTSLCEYFWTVVLCCFIFPFKGIWHILPNIMTDHEDIAKAVILWAICSAFLHYFLVYQFSIKEINSDMWYLSIIIFFGGIGIALGIVGLLAVVFKANEVFDNYVKKKQEEKKPHQPSKPSLLVEFLKANKKKVCPCVKFVDEEEN